MKNSLTKKRYKGPYISTYFSLKPQSYDENLNLRRRSLAFLDTKIKSSFAKLNSYLNKINYVKDSVLNNKYDFRDAKLMKNLDDNCLFLSKSFAKEAKNASKLSGGYNLSSHDLDIFIKNLKKKKKKIKTKKELNKNDEISEDNFDKYKDEFNLASLGLNKKEKIKNNSFLINQQKRRDLYNLKLELKLIDRRKKIGEKKTFEVKTNSANIFLIDKDKRRNKKYDNIKSRYFEKYELSKSFENKDDLIEKNILNEMCKIDDETDNKNKEDIFITSNKEDNKNINNDNIDNNKETLLITKKTILKDVNKINDYNFNFTNNLFHKTRNSFSASNFNNIKTTKHLSSSAIINFSKNKNSEPKQPIKLRLKSGINIKKNNIISTGLYNKIYNNNNRRNRNSRSNNYISSATNSKQTIYTTNKSLSRPYSSFSSYNNTTYHFNTNKINSKVNISALGSKKNFESYIKDINNILRYSDYSTEKFKKATSEFNKKKLFVKSNRKIFEKKKIVNIEKIIKNLNLDKNPHSIINDKKLVYNNSFKVKSMLNLKNRKILNTFLLKLFDEQRRLNKYFIDTSKYEKNLKKFEMNKIFNILSNKIINFEKKYDKEKILEIFEPDDVNAFLKKREEMFEIYDEKEYKFILLKNKNMKIMEKENNRKKNINGNLYKKHLVAKYKKID